MRSLVSPTRLAAVLCVLALSSFASADQLKTYLTDAAGNVSDAFLSQANPNSANGANWSIYVGEFASATTDARGLVRFDLPALPPGAVVTQATLAISVHTNTAATTMNLYRVLKPWVENQATWNSAATGTLWSAPGLSSSTASPDYDATVVATATAPVTGGGFAQWDITAAFNNWKSGAWSNYGLLIKSPTDIERNVRFVGSEITTQSIQPYLLLTYQVPEPASLGLASLGLLLLRRPRA